MSKADSITWLATLSEDDIRLAQVEAIKAACSDQGDLEAMDVSEFVDLWVCLILGVSPLSVS